MEQSALYSKTAVAFVSIAVLLYNAIRLCV